MPRKAAISLISLITMTGAILPTSAHAFSYGDTLAQGGIFPAIKQFFVTEAASIAQTTTPNVQTLPLLQSALAATKDASGGGEVIIADESALLPEEGPAGAGGDIVRSKNSTISIYVVREGDTLSGIGEMFDVSVNTIIWGNDLKRGAPLKVGQTLTILPVTGVKYTVKKGDTLESIAKKLHGDAAEIASFNGVDTASLAVGDEIIVPNGEIQVAAAPAQKSAAKAAQYTGYYIRPLSGGVRSQGVHGYNGVDIAAPVGTPIMASASGEVIVAKGSGWNGGYGEYVVIRHENGTQTLYAHASEVIVGIGERVVQGQIIAYVGSTGRSTGAHLHFEIRGGPRNPF